ncbi:Hypothetical_protein [Hexamita inflata]|uniref:Hypothetical_protein n=1 Tax=Hexamita inflata TaxID=28002 RepID=A0AA86RC26_9EUKA|nr:Hypothetical protein HINF_LOCUS62878 [Hexamita inflata]CAI9975237.1 Hypothetical protein HINF_LOCUS62882 [Hexamita inflata]CAI9975241.1 Hypothetical protein HINF_LOCUS62886 [Hexamita inflata]
MYDSRTRCLLSFVMRGCYRNCLQEICNSHGKHSTDRRSGNDTKQKRRRLLICRSLAKRSGFQFTTLSICRANTYTFNGMQYIVDYKYARTIWHFKRFSQFC